MGMTEEADHSRRRLPGVGNLPGAGFLGDRLNDVVALLAALPDIAMHLRAIETHVVNLDSEVTMMRQRVDELGAEVKVLRAEMAEVALGLSEVGASVDRLEPHVSDLSRLARPLKRMRNRVSSERHSAQQLPNGDDEPPVTGLA